MAYENETQEVIQRRMSDEARDDIDKRQGSVFYDLTSPMSIELSTAYTELNKVLSYGFASENTPREYLILRAREIGIIPQQAVKAVGEVTFYGDDDVVINEGTIVYTDEEEPIFFETTEEGTIENGSVTVSAEAQSAGSDGNVAAETITLLSGDLTGVTSVINEDYFEGGSDEESNESLLQRYLERARNPSTSGNANHYKQWATSVDGVGDAKVYPLWNGNGTVKVILLDTEMTFPIQDTIDNVADYIESVRPIGADVTVVGAEEISINISANITLTSNGSIDDVIAQVNESVTEYLKSLAFNDPIVRRTHVGNLLLDADGVLDYANLTINGTTSNIEINDGDVAVIGEVTLIET